MTYQHFNSQPHEEADWEILQTRGRRLHFNSQPHEEADDFRDKFCLSVYYFNSQPHEEADVFPVPLPPQIKLFQLTASRGG